MPYKQYCILNNFENLPSVIGDGCQCICIPSSQNMINPSI